MEDELCIRLYRDNDILACCKAHYIGLMGMFVDANPLKYPKGTNLDVEISVNNLSGTNQHRLAATVTSRSIKGVGLTFVNLNKRTRLILRDIILLMHQKNQDQRLNSISAIPTEDHTEEYGYRSIK
ncbi:MAG: hypothetical protein KAR30_00830 [Gammaproteobacteria bacterium]|nr:hypothetical protein [Gammaproteobacteria bacterium]